MNAQPTTHKLFQVTRDGSPVSPILATDSDVLAWFHRTVPYSMDHATRHEGYAVAEITPEPRTDMDRRSASFSVGVFDHGHAPTSDRLVRENCGACALEGYGEWRDEEHGHLAPNYAGWARIFVEAGRPIPQRWRAAFLAELNETNEDGQPTPYALGIRRDVGAFGVRYTD